MNTVHAMQRARGAVLLVCLLVLLLLGLLGTTVARTSLLHLHMAGNDENRLSALQQAMAVVDAVLAAGPGLPLSYPVAYRSCTAHAGPQPCDAELQLPATLPSAPGRMDAVVERLAPHAARMPRLNEEGASSTVFYRVARFEIRGTYDGTAEGLGRAAIIQGVLVRMEH